MKPLLSLLALFCIAISSCDRKSVEPTPVSIRATADDASRISANSFLRLVESYFSPDDDLSTLDVTIAIDDQEIAVEFYDVSKSPISICSSGIELSGEKFLFGDEEISKEAFTERMKVWAEAARLTESKAGLYLNATDDVSLKQLHEHLSLMTSAGVSQILISSWKPEEPIKTSIPVSRHLKLDSR